MTTNRRLARQFLDFARNGVVKICTSTKVLQEILYRYSALGKPDLAKAVYDLFVEICPSVLPVTLADTDVARALIMKTRGISARDALHAGVMLNHGIPSIATFDRDFDGIAGIHRFQMSDSPAAYHDP